MRLDIKNLSVKIKNKTIIDNLNLSLKEGEILGIKGPSGCGKSTLLYSILGALEPDFTVQGTILLNERNITHLSVERRNIGILFQESILFDHLNVLENLIFGMKEKNKIAIAIDELSKINLSHTQKMFPSQLSGGQKNRIALLQALLNHPYLMLLDEPFSNLDKAVRQSFRQFVKTRLKHLGTSAIMVTHDEEDLEIASKVFNWDIQN